MSNMGRKRREQGHLRKLEQETFIDILWSIFYSRHSSCCVYISLWPPKEVCVCKHERVCTHVRAHTHTHTHTKSCLTHTLYCRIQQVLDRCHYNGHFRRGTWGLQRSFKFHMVKLYSKWWSLKSSQLQTSDSVLYCFYQPRGPQSVLIKDCTVILFLVQADC